MEFTMRAHQIMTRPVITVTPDTTIVEAAKIMLKHHISGLNGRRSHALAPALLCTPMAIPTALIAPWRPTPNHRVGNGDRELKIAN